MLSWWTNETLFPIQYFNNYCSVHISEKSTAVPYGANFFILHSWQMIIADEFTCDSFLCVFNCVYFLNWSLAARTTINMSFCTNLLVIVWHLHGDIYMANIVSMGSVLCISSVLSDYCYISESESECKCLTCNQKPTGSQFSLLHEPN